MLNMIKYKRNSYEGESIPMAIKRRFPIRVATVYCSGGCRAKKDEDGALLCAYGCIGCEACVNACRFDAIEIVKGTAKVDPDKCVGCKLCTKVCPRDAILPKATAEEKEKYKAIKKAQAEKAAAAKKAAEEAAPQA